jgi:hypothetical protein
MLRRIFAKALTFTNGHWINGLFYVIAVAYLISVYIRRERKLKGQGRGRRY